MLQKSEPTYIDIGANLTHRSFGHDLNAVLQRAQASGVAHMGITGTSLRGSQDAVHLARSQPELLFATVGVHPHNAKSWHSGTLASLKKFAKDPVARAIGECGLDYNRDFSPRAQQRTCLTQQLELAVEQNLPVFLHERDAHNDFVAILKEYRPALSRAVVHCFTGTQAALEAYLGLDMHIGLTGWINDERRGRHLKGLVPQIPADRLMIETDAPFLTPRTMPNPPRRNEPAFLPFVAQAIADCSNKDLAQVAEETTATACSFFGMSASSCNIE